VRREGDRLVVARGGGGPPVVLQDDTTEGARFVRHAYRAHLASIGAHLVELRHYEGSSYLLIDARSGAATPLSGPPVVSPDGRRFVTTSMDLEAGYDPNEIEIWRVTDSVRQLEFSHRPDGWGPSDAVWRDTATIELRKHEMAPDGSSPRVTPLRLTRDGTTWSLHDLSR